MISLFRICYIIISLLVAFNYSKVEAAEEVEKVAPDASLKEKADKGWWWYEQAVKKQEETNNPSPTQPLAREPSKEEQCKKKDTWKPDCGFIDPGNDFEFQAKQRDELMQGMVMSNNDPKAVEAVQYYMKWMTDRAIQVANIWYYNMAQNPDLNPSTNAPISQFGLRLASEVEKADKQSLFKKIAEEGALVYFSRSDCHYCHSMAPSILKVSKSTGIEVWDASLDDTCMPNFKKCLTAAKTTKPAQILQVATVPTLFLHVKPDTWIRVSTGVESEDEIMSRIAMFFSAYRSAILKGIQNGGDGKAPVDFSPSGSLGGNAKGVVPTEKDVKSILDKAN